MWLVFRQAFLEPLRSTATTLVLLVGMLIPLAIVGMAVLLTDQEILVTASLQSASTWIFYFMLVPVLVLTLPLISGEARSRVLLMNLMLPVSRSDYYAGRVLGRATFCLLYFMVTLTGLFLTLKAVADWAFVESGIRLPPDLATSMILTGLTLVSVVLSICALAPLSSTRYGHLIYWLGLYFVVSQARTMRATVTMSTFENGISWFALELLHPFLLGPDPAYIDLAALSGWHLARALLQWGFGASLAVSLGLVAFSRMEIGKRV